METKKTTEAKAVMKLNELQATKRSMRDKWKRLLAFVLALGMLYQVIGVVDATTGASGDGVPSGDANIPVSSDATSSEQTSTAAPANSSTKAEATTKANVTTAEKNTTESKTTTEAKKSSTTTSKKVANYTERKAVWFSFSDLTMEKNTKAYFKKQINTMFDNVVSMGMNTAVVHVRPFSDAMYESDYFPWSVVASGKQGKNPGYDPLEIMVKAAHDRNLRLEAWINPYRVTSNSTSISKLAKDNPARIWYKKKSTRRNVLIYNGQIYYNPAKAEVRELICDGVEEIVENYDVDAIHFDDYFYPNLGYRYKTAFDAPEYNAYVKKQKAAGKASLPIYKWRREQVNKLVKQVYQTVKDANSKVQFGISPAGNIQNLRSMYSYYVDIDKWMSTPGYVDYICPQVYWGFQNGQYSFDKVLKGWLSLKKSSKVDFYVGIGFYRAVYQDQREYRTSKTVMKRSVAYARKYSRVKGFYFFTYRSFTDSRGATEKKNLVKELKKRK